MTCQLKHKEAIVAEIKAPIGPQPIDRISSPLINNFRFASKRPWPGGQAHLLVCLLAYAYQNALANPHQVKTRPEVAPYRAIAPPLQSFPTGKSGESVWRMSPHPLGCVTRHTGSAQPTTVVPNHLRLRSVTATAAAMKKYHYRAPPAFLPCAGSSNLGQMEWSQWRKSCAASGSRCC